MKASIAHSLIRNFVTPVTFATTLVSVTFGQLKVAGSPLFADQPDKQARQKVNEGLEQYSSGDFEQAAKSFAEAAQAAPDNPIIKFDQACAVSAAGDDDKARELLLQASASSDTHVSAVACYNLAAIAAKRGRKELGDDPMSVAPEVRQAALDRLKAAVAHYRDCLRIAPEHSDARHNLELVLTLINYLQQHWQMRDHQQAVEKMSLFELLRNLDDQQLSLRSTTIPYKGQSTAKVSRFDRSKLASQQMKLLEDIPTLTSKIDAQLGNSPDGTAATPNGPGNAVPSKQSEVEVQIRKLVTEQLDQASESIRQAAEDVRSANWDRALERQRFTIDRFRQLLSLFSAFPENLDLAIELQESLIEINANEKPSSTAPTSAMAAKKDSSTDGQSWQQDWVSNFSQSLAAKANASLQSLPTEDPASQSNAAPLKDLPESAIPSETIEADKAEAEKTEAGNTEAEQASVKTLELNHDENSELTPQQQQLKQQEEFAKQLRKALERTVELAPTILERSNEARRLISDSQNASARPAQEDVLRMLNEIRDLLPKQPNQDQDQNNGQNQDQNKDQKNSDQEKQNQQQKSKDQKENSESGQDKKQDKSQNQDKSPTDKPKSNDSKDPSDSDKSQPEKKPETEQSQPKDRSEEAANKPAEEQTKEQADKESDKANPGSKAAEQTAQQIAEQRAQAVLRRIREREAKYRELLLQLRERQAQQTPVEKDW